MCTGCAVSVSSYAEGWLTFLRANRDNVLTARSIAVQCGIFTAGGVIMEGPVFRKLTKSERDTIVPRLQVRSHLVPFSEPRS